MLDKIAIGEVVKSTELTSLAPKQRLHLILLGVEDVAKAASFYAALGWKQSLTSHSGFVKIDLGGYALCLLPRNDFAKDALAPTSQGSGFSGVGLVYLAPNADDVPRILTRAVESGGTLVKPATRTAWGVAGYFLDLDGYLFEVDYEDTWVFDSDHHLVVD